MTTIPGRLAARHVDLVRQGRYILHDVSLTATPGRLLVLIGPNGAGKSSLLKVLAGLAPVSAGSATLEDRALSAWHPRDLARRRAMLSQRVDLAFGFTVEEVVALGRGPHPADRSRDACIVDAALHAAHAWELRRQRYTVLSGGERQRVQLARVLAQVWDGAAHGAWLLLDEPEAGLDIAHQHFILRRARALATQGFGVVAVLHDLALAARYADDVALMAGGHLLRQGAPATTLDPSLLSEVYGIALVRGAAGRIEVA